MTYMMMDQDIVRRQPGDGVSRAQIGWPACALEP